MKARRKNNFYQNVASAGKKRQKSTNGNTTLDKESIFELIKAVFKEEFERQQQDISKKISNNLTITKQETAKLREQINDMKKGIEFTENVLKDKVSKNEQEFCELKGKLTKVDEDLTYMNNHIQATENIHNKLVELEDRQKQNNIRMDGLKGDSKESWEECESSVNSMLKERLVKQNVEIELHIE